MLTFVSSGIMVPTISNADEARSVVKLSKFPPVGVRGQGSPFACFEHGLPTPSEYVKKANETIITMVQIETTEGVDNVDEICQVEGVGESSIALFCNCEIKLTVRASQTFSSLDQTTFR